MENTNPKEMVNKYLNQILENIRSIGKPSATVGQETPPDFYPSDDDDEDQNNNPELRKNRKIIELIELIELIFS